MKIRLSELKKLIRESMVAAPSKDNPLMVWPKVGPSGGLMWIVEDGLQTTVIDTITGEIHGNQAANSSEAFKTIVGAIGEWYKIDREEYAGENIVKVKDEVD